MTDAERRRGTAWCRKHSTDLDDFLEGIDAGAWREARVTEQQILSLRQSLLESYGLHGASAGDIGGGPGNIALLYWLVRVFHPQTAVETGVASGASSRAILQAMFANGSGHLYSSDLAVYLPQEHSGLCVDDEMKSRWSLLHRGDRINIPLILRQTASIDLFHYDSAKDAEEMRWVVNQVEPLLSRTAVVVLDDIDRHSFMRHYVQGLEKSWFIFGSVGVVGLEEARDAQR